MFFVSDVYRYVLIKPGKVSGDFGLFALIEHHDNITITLQKFFIWDSLEIDWYQVNVWSMERNLNYSLSLHNLYYINIRLNK